MRDLIMKAGFDAEAVDVSHLLRLAATPVFAGMALATEGGGMADMPGMDMPASPLQGMALMYLLMAVFHAAPWAELFAGRRKIITSDQGSNA